jgi:hypothetical protein
VEKGDKDWRKLAFAFYALAHNDASEFNALEPRLKNTDVGKLCSEYNQSRDHELIERAGYLLTGTKHWYVYIGRM